MKKKNFFITAVMAVTLFASCSNDELAQQQPDIATRHAIELTTSIETSGTRTAGKPVTRAAASLQSTTVDTQSTLGVFVTYNSQQSTTPSSVNVPFTYSSDSQTWSPTSPIYFPSDGSSIDITVYTPYQDDITTVDDIPTADNFTVKSDQTSDADYLASDLLTGSRSTVFYTGLPTNVTLQHMLSKVSVTITPGKGLTIDDLKGAYMKIGSVGITLPTSFADDATNITQAVILTPATLSPATELISITFPSGVYYQYILQSELTLAAGNQYSYAFTINAMGITLNTASVTDWMTGGTFNDGEMKTE